MSSSGMWKVENCVQPVMSMGHSILFPTGPLPITTSQDEPIDFSQKSDTSDDAKASPKTECGSIRQNGYGHPSNNVLTKGYGSLEHLYYVRNATEPPMRRPCGDGVKHGQISLPIQSPDSMSRIGNASPTVVPYHCEVIGSPSSHQSDACRESSKSHDRDVDMSSVSSPENLVSNSTHGKGQKRGLEENGHEEDGCKEVPGPAEGSGIVYPMLSKYLAAPPQQQVGTSSDRVPMHATALAQMLTNGNKNTSELPKLTIPITNPMMVRKTNGSSPGIVNSVLAPYQVDDSSRMMPMPNPWEVFPSPYHDDKKGQRSVRPFKAFGNDILNSCNPDILASVGLGGGGRSIAFDKYIKFRSDYMDNRNDVTTTNNHPTGSSSPESVRRANDSNDSSPSPRIGNGDDSTQDHQLDHNDHSRRRCGNRFPDHQKDPAYWERRRKNNEAAKRSRDARRRKEDALAMTAKELIEDKMRMTMHLTFQLKEMQKLEEENKFLKEREASLQTYLFHLESRCRDCTKCSSRGSEKRPAMQNQI